MEAATVRVSKLSARKRDVQHVNKTLASRKLTLRHAIRLNFNRSRIHHNQIKDRVALPLYIAAFLNRYLFFFF